MFITVQRFYFKFVLNQDAALARLDKLQSLKGGSEAQAATEKEVSIMQCYCFATVKLIIH